MSQTYNADEFGQAIDATVEGSQFNVRYDSAHSDESQEMGGEVLSVGETWNGAQLEVTFKNGDGHYRLRIDPETGEGTLERLQYEWCHGERKNLDNTQRITNISPGAEGLYGFEVA